jgi:hypothetical protein
MPRAHLRWIPLACLLLAQPAAAQFNELAAKIPSSANAIVLLDGQKLLASPIAVSEGWKEKYEQAFASGLASISPDTRQLVLASQLDYEYMQPLWEVAVADLGRERSLAEIARRTSSTLDPIGQTQAVALRDNAFLVALGPQRLGVMSPANRQSVARWLQDIDSRTQPALSQYLQGTLAASQTSAIVMAFDLQDAVPPDVIRAKLATSAALAGKNIDLDAATKALASLRGMSLEVAFTDGTFGRLMVHFNGDAGVLAPVAKPLLMEILANLGAAIDDIDEWQVEAQPQRILFRGPLSPAGRKRVFSLIDHPTSMLIAADAQSADPQEREKTQAAAASLQYFKAMTSILDDVREESKDAKTFGQNALWFDKWARRIDKLPSLNVDPELLTFGRETAGGLRTMAAAMRGIGINTAARSAQIYGSGASNVNVSGAPGYWGYGGSMSYYAEWRDVDAERRAVKAEEKAKGAISARGMAAQIANETGRVRQVMTQKYQVQF